MDSRTFDRWTTALAHHPTRRATVRLLAGSLIAALLPLREAAPTRALQRPDSDGDGLFDDDEPGYHTDPNNPDSDGDGIDDGQEVYDGTDPSTPEGGAEPADTGCAPGECVQIDKPLPDAVYTTCAAQGLTDCGYCTNLQTDPNNCGVCGRYCSLVDNLVCRGGICTTY